jgi:hypothetical protein
MLTRGAPRMATTQTRGGCLSLFLGAAMFSSLGYALRDLYTLATVSALDGLSRVALPATTALGVAVFVCALALWHWRKWGLYGYVALTFLQLGVLLMYYAWFDRELIVAALGSVVRMAVLLALLRPVWQRLR